MPGWKPVLRESCKTNPILPSFAAAQIAFPSRSTASHLASTSRPSNFAALAGCTAIGSSKRTHHRLRRRKCRSIHLLRNAGTSRESSAAARAVRDMKLLEKLSYLGVVLPTFSSLLNGGGDPFDAAGVDGVNVRLYRGWPGNPKLLDNWSALARSAPCGSVFQSPAWQGAVARAFIRVGRYRLCTVHRGDSLRA